MSKHGIGFSLSFVAWLVVAHPAMSDETAVSVYGLAPELYEQFFADTECHSITGRV